MKSPQDIYVTSNNAILMIVDVQNHGCAPGGESYDETRAQVVPGMVRAIQGLAGKARKAGIPVIYIQSVRTLEEAEFIVFGHPPYLKIGTWEVEIIEELKPQPGDIVVQKRCHDPFFKTNLDRVLQKLVPDPTRCHALLTGGSVNYCLYHGAMGFHLRDYWTVVVTDAVYYRGEAAKLRALEQFSDRGYANIFFSRSDLIHFSSDVS